MRKCDVIVSIKRTTRDVIKRSTRDVIKHSTLVVIKRKTRCYSTVISRSLFEYSEHH